MAGILSLSATLWIHYHQLTLDVLVAETLITAALSWGVLYVIHVTQRYFHSSNVFNFSNISMLLLFTAIQIGVFHLSFSALYSESSVLMSAHQSTLLIRGVILFLFYAICLMSFWIHQQKIREERIQHFAIEKERESIRIQLNSIQQQFKPHFLFNSLNSIGALCINNPKEARKMIQLLSDFMRKAVREHENEMISLEEEIVHMQRYTEIEKIRFGHRLNITYEIEDECLPILIPSFILQPIIENAIKYGLYGSIDDVEIIIEVRKKEAHTLITVSNPFDADSSQETGGTGYGLKSIHKKLRLIYKQGNLLSTYQADNLFITELTIPNP